MPNASLADFPFEASASFTAALGSSLGAVFAALADVSPLVSILGGSGGGGGGTDIPLGAAGGSETCATYSGEKNMSTVSPNMFKFNQSQLMCKIKRWQMRENDLKSCYGCERVLTVGVAAG